jgi:hypothetical protein
MVGAIMLVLVRHGGDEGVVLDEGPLFLFMRSLIQLQISLVQRQMPHHYSMCGSVASNNLYSKLKGIYLFANS